ncbi:hypothetical protein QWY86_07740 [Pedobacter aquatilis]|uniref:hypothetical protein n=1 Tax=Pedobacter aquatilis TaxID=351343 RepID=UPI0025B4425C|nr:hypothetical protein [Pedobacter aquatilis]MDN3586550.1 hypothetical protein [Pedobacter aquatilis]
MDSKISKLHQWLKAQHILKITIINNLLATPLLNLGGARGDLNFQKGEEPA